MILFKKKESIFWSVMEGERGRRQKRMRIEKKVADEDFLALEKFSLPKGIFVRTDSEREREKKKLMSSSQEASFSRCQDISNISISIFHSLLSERSSFPCISLMTVEMSPLSKNRELRDHDGRMEERERGNDHKEL